MALLSITQPKLGLYSRQNEVSNSVCHVTEFRIKNVPSPGPLVKLSGEKSRVFQDPGTGHGYGYGAKEPQKGKALLNQVFHSEPDSSELLQLKIKRFSFDSRSSPGFQIGVETLEVQRTRLLLSEFLRFCNFLVGLTLILQIFVYDSSAYIFKIPKEMYFLLSGNSFPNYLLSVTLSKTLCEYQCRLSVRPSVPVITREWVTINSSGFP